MTMPRVQRSIYVDEDLWKRLRVMALNGDRSASDIVEDALRVYVDNNKIKEPQPKEKAHV